MKLLFTLLCLLAGSFAAHAQTEAQTLEWLNAKSIDIGTVGTDNLGYDEKNKPSFTLEKIRVDGCCGGYKYYTWDKIKEVKRDSPFILIIFSDSTSTSPSYMKFYYITESSAMINAIKHMATLKGAKLLDSDMFK